MGEAIAAVCFDLDGTLVDSEGEAADAFELAMEPLGRRLSPKSATLSSVMALAKSMRSSKPVAAAVVQQRAGRSSVRGAGDAVCAQRCGRATRRQRSGAQAVVTLAVCARDGLDAVGSEPDAGSAGHHRLLYVTLCAGEYPQGKPSPIPYQQAAQALGSARSSVAIEDRRLGFSQHAARACTASVARRKSLRTGSVARTPARRHLCSMSSRCYFLERI